MLHALTVPESARDLRLDVWLTTAVEGCTRSLISRLIGDGHCLVEPGQAKAGYRLRGGERISLDVPEVEPMTAAPEDIPLDVLHDDAHLIVINKPAGMVVHPAIGHLRGTLVNALLGRWQSAATTTEDLRPGIAHRLDAETSGVIVVARTPAALVFLQAAFKARDVRKRYLALLAGSPRADVLTCAAPLGRHPRDFRKRAVVEADAPDARSAETTVLIISRHSGYSVAECRPRTGRTHQIRVHCSHLGHPILADSLYGRSARWPLAPDAPEPVLRRHALHAWELDIPHPSGGRLQIQAPIPSDLLPWTGQPKPRTW